MVTPDNTLYPLGEKGAFPSRMSLYSRVPCPVCHEETENVRIKREDEIPYQKAKSQHAADCRLFAETKEEPNVPTL